MKISLTTKPASESLRSKSIAPSTESEKRLPVGDEMNACVDILKQPK